MVEADEEGERRPFNDRLLDEMVGKWKIIGKIAGQEIEHSAQIDWVLRHQFLQIHFRDVKNHPAEYEALVFIGYDHNSKRYLLHWLDIFGARFSETLGYGTKIGENDIMFSFDYPDGSLNNTLSWDSHGKTWRMRIEQRDEHGRWGVFADETFTR